MANLQAVVLFSSAAFLGACSSPGARVWAGYMQSEFRGEMGVSDPASSIQGRADVEDDLGVADAYDTPYGRVELDAGPLRATGSVFTYKGSGNGMLRFDFGDISANATTVTDIEMLVAKGALSFDIDIGPVRLSPGLGATLLDFEAMLEGTTPPPLVLQQTEEIDELLPVPLLFLQAEVDLGMFGAEAEIGGLDVHVNDVDLTLIDVELMAYVRLFKHAELFAGYRFIALELSGEIDDREVDADFDVGGWFVGGGVSF